MLNYFFFQEIPSTQKWLVSYLKENQEYQLPLYVFTQKQTMGVGSRDNRWESVENAILFSFAFYQEDLPKDLPLQSLSIYVGNLMEQFLAQKGFDIWVKWPNDLYCGDQKIGGVMTQIVKKSCVCGIGINLSSSNFASLQIEMSLEEKHQFIQDFLHFFLTYPTWGEILRNYKIKFYKNYPYSFHYGDKVISFKDALLCEDGAVMIENQKFYTLR